MFFIIILLLFYQETRSNTQIISAISYQFFVRK